MKVIKKNALRPKLSWFGRMKQRYEVIQEMIGRRDMTVWNKVRAVWNIYTQPTYDTSKVNYAFAKSLYFSSEVTDNRTGLKVGSKFVLGAVFAKPIVNSITNFTLSNQIQIDHTDEYTKNSVNTWLKQNHGTLLQIVRNAFRDGDSYIKIDSAANGSMIAPECVDKIVNSRNINELQGYDVTYVFGEEDGVKLRQYLTEYRKGKKTEYEVRDGTKTQVSETIYNKDQPFEIIAISNEPEPNALYGNTEYQSCISLMANYHAVLESAIENHIYNSTPIPCIEGIENMAEFLKQNGELNDDGEYEVDWQSKKMLLLGKGGTAKMLQSTDTSKGTESLLNIIFWCICQSSETPEFVFGTAVQSSKASVSEQMPIMVAKAQRKQAILIKPFRELIELLMYQLKRSDSKIKIDNFDLIMPNIVNEDKKLNLDIVKVLLEQGVITKETAATIVGVGEYVKNVQIEVGNAKKEQEDKIQNELTFLPTEETKRASKE